MSDPGAPSSGPYCSLCGSTSLAPLYPLDRAQVVRCNECSLVFLALDPAHGPIEQLYDPAYFEERQAYFHVDQDLDERSDAVIRNYRHGLDLLERFGARRDTLLDVGCATGDFLGLAQRAGWRVAGLDISSYAAQYCRERWGCDVRAGHLEEAGFRPGEFAVVTLWDVLEHFADPLAELATIHSLLRPGGLLLLDTPNERSFIRNLAGMLFRASGGQIDYPIRKLFHRFHLYYFSPRTLHCLLEKAGFELLYLGGRPIPFGKGRANLLERLMVQAFSLPERLLRREFELVAVARKV